MFPDARLVLDYHITGVHGAFYRYICAWRILHVYMCTWCILQVQVYMVYFTGTGVHGVFYSIIYCVGFL